VLLLVIMKWSAAAIVFAVVSVPSGAFVVPTPQTSSSTVATKRIGGPGVVVARSSTSSSTHLFTILDRKTGQSQLDPAVLDRFMALPFPPDKILAEYVWVDADGNTRSKTRTLAAEKVRAAMATTMNGDVIQLGDADISLTVNFSHPYCLETGQIGGQAPRVEL
jgi:hypothetical protein